VVPAWRVAVVLAEESGPLRLAAGFVEDGGALLPQGRQLDAADYPEVQRAMATRAPVLVADVERDPLMQGVRHAVGEAGIRSLFVVPLLVGDRCLGVLSLAQRPRVRRFSARERSLAQAVANQAAVAIRNAQLYGELRAAAEELEAKVERRNRKLEESHLKLNVLNEIAAAVNVSLDVERVVQAALRGLERLPAVDRAQVCLVEDVPAGLCRVFTLDAERRVREHEVEVGDTLLDRADRALSLAGRWLAPSDEPAPPPLPSHLLAPLVSKEGVIGAVQVFSGRPGAHSGDDVELLQQVAGELSLAVERSLLYRAAQRRSKQFEVLSDLGRQLTGAVTLENLLPTAAQLVQRSLGYSMVTVLVLDEDEEQLVAAGVAAADPAVAQRVENHRMPANAGLCGRAIATGRPVLAVDVSTEPDFVPVADVPTRSELAVPLILTSEAVGVIDLQADRPGAFGPNDLALMRTVADQVAAALHLSRLFDDLHRQGEFTERVMNNLTGGLIVTDRRRVVQVVNLRGAEILQVDRWDLLGRDLLEVIPTAAPLFHYAPDTLSRECEIARPDGTRIPVGFSNAFFADAGHDSEAVIITFRDLSEIRELQRKVRHAERLATIGTVAAGVAHEIRNPLFGISATAQVLASELPAGSPLVELATGMLEETRRLNKIVEALVTYGRPQRLHLAPVDAAALAEGVVAQVRSRAAEQGTAVALRLAAGPLSFQADADQVRQVVLNLLINACDAAPGGHVAVSVEPGDEEVVFRVCDDGPGLKPEQIDKVFDLFYTTKPKGSGMGLAISSKIVEDHGGSLVATSPPGGGACFEVRLPVRALQGGAGGTLEDDAGGSGPIPASSPARTP